jgi:hypothetical protein
VIIHELLHGFVTDTLYARASFKPREVQEVMDEKRDVFDTIAKRWDFDGQDIQPVE